MEPMTLGSPVGSPAIPSSPGAPSPYLPEFLTGESTPVGGAQNVASSPGKLSKHVSFGALPILRNSTPGPVENRISMGTPLMLNASHTPDKKSSGPPTKGLFDMLSSPSEFHTPTQSSSLRYSNVTESSHRDITWTEADEAHNTWVTIFGFPPSAASFILSQFSHYGNILEKRMPAKGNWMHVRYQTKLECRKALSNNGKVFGGTIMIGVMPCKDQEILNDIKNKENVHYQKMSFVEPIASTSRGTPNVSVTSPSSVLGTPNRYNTSNLSYSETPGRKNCNVRPLGQAYRMAQADSEVLTQSHSPQRSSGVVSKAMEYVFGW